MGQNLLRGLPAENERLARAMTLTGFELKEEEWFPFHQWAEQWSVWHRQLCSLMTPSSLLSVDNACCVKPLSKT
jgi:hypothetical protein